MAQQLVHSVESATLADILERVLDKGIVIAGDIKIKLVDIELLTIQIRLMIASVDKAKEMGMDWWVRNPDFNSALRESERAKEVEELKKRVAELEHQDAGGDRSAERKAADVQSLRLPKRILEALAREGIQTVDELRRKTREELVAIPEIGKGNLSQIRKALGPKR